MFLLVGGDSTIGAATAGVLRARKMPFLATSRRRDARDALPLDLRAIDEFAVPPGVTAACIFAAVARLGDCAADPEGTRAINVLGTLALAEKLAAAGVFTLYLSTDKVFDGTRPLVPADAPLSPASEYGRQKAEAETALRALGVPLGILRLAKVVPPRMALFAGWDTALRAGQPVGAFTAMMVAPTPIDLVATRLADMLATRDAAVRQLSGPRDVSYFEIARFIARRAVADEALVEPTDGAAVMPPGGLAAHTTLATEIAVPDAFAVVDWSLGENSPARPTR